MWNLWRATFLLLPYLVLAVELTLAWRYAKPGRKAIRTCLWFGLFAASKFTGFQLLGGNLSNPELPVWVIAAWGWMESVVWVAFPVSLIALATAAVMRRFRPLAFGTVIAASVALATYGMWDGMRVPPVEEREVVFENLPPAFDGYRIVHLSDLHCSSAARRGKIKGLVARANECRADLVVITGDFVDGRPADRAIDIEPLRELRAKDGVYACTGNHELYWGIEAWSPYYARWNVRFLQDNWTEIRRGDDSIQLGGVDDPVLDGDADEVFFGAPTNGFRVLLSHRPTVYLNGKTTPGVNLQLSGHTHGGAMPVIARIVAIANEGRVRGFYKCDDGRIIHVSPGSGQWAGFPLRLFDPPEITVLTLRRNSARWPDL